MIEAEARDKWQVSAYLLDLEFQRERFEAQMKYFARHITPKSDYEIALDELNKEFPSIDTKDIAESASQEKSVQSGIARFFSGALALLGAGFILYYVYLLIIWLDTIL